MEPQLKPMFPHSVDSTILSTFRSCPYKFSKQYVEHWKATQQSVHLVAGGAFASAIEAARNAFYVEGRSSADAEAIGLSALVAHYGDFDCPPDSAKSLERMCGAFEFYLFNYPLGADGADPITLPSGRRGIEFSFAEPLEVRHPVTGDPILYTGRSDMIANRYGAGVWIYDEKTTSSLGATWGRQWEMRCFSGDTELLTRRGWKRIDQLPKSDCEVMQSDSEGNLSFEFPTAYHCYATSTPLIHIKGRRVDQLVTKNHRILLNKRRGGTTTILAEDLATYDQQSRLPLAGRHTEERLPDQLQRFLVAVQADGSLRKSKGEVESGRGHREHMPFPGIAFKFVKQRKVERLADLLQSMKADYTHNPETGEFYISGFSGLAELVSRFLSPEKLFIEGQESFYGDAFLNELRHWDGWEKQYYTKHRSNADFVATVAALNDRTASVTLNLKDNYTVVLSDGADRSLKSLTFTETPFNGTVYCVTVPTGYLLTRRNGQISLSGNSQFTGYSWAARRQGIKTAGAIVRGVSILKTKYDTLEVQTYRSDYEIDRWEQQVNRDIRRMIRSWEEGYWDYSLDGACTDYGGCSFVQVCKASNPDEWLPAKFEQRVWDPLARAELSVAELEASWGHVRHPSLPPAPGLPGKTTDDGNDLASELRGMM